MIKCIASKTFPHQYTSELVQGVVSQNAVPACVLLNGHDRSSVFSSRSVLHSGSVLSGALLFRIGCLLCWPSPRKACDKISLLCQHPFVYIGGEILALRVDDYISVLLAQFINKYHSCVVDMPGDWKHGKYTNGLILCNWFSERRAIGEDAGFFLSFKNE